MKDEREHITELLNKRTDLIQLVLVAAVLSLGINLLASWLVQSQGFGSYVWILASFLVISSLVWLTVVALRSRYFYSEIDASFLLDVRHNRVLSFSEYDFARDLYIMLNGVLKENRAFQETWNQSPLIPFRKDSGKQKNHGTKTKDAKEPQYVFITKVHKGKKDEEPKSVALVSEAVEFLLIHELSMHLSAYFDKREEHEKYTKEYKRDDIPEILLQNRVLDLLTRPFEEREPFIRFLKEDHRDVEGEIHTIFGTDGTVYDRFHLQLPTGTKLRRLLPGMLELENKRLSLLLTVRLEGFSTSLLSHVVSLLKREDPDEVVAYNVGIGLHYRVKALSLLSRSGWEYYKWVDSFVSEMTRKLSVKEYLHKTNWHTIALINKVINAKSVESSNSKKGGSRKPNAA